MILPMVLRGSDSRNSTATRRCVLLSWPLAQSRTSASRRRGARPAHAERQRRFAPLLARDADHRDVDHVGMPEQQHLDVGGIDVEAAGNDHVLLAVEQDDEAVLVDAAHVARLEEQAAVLVVPEQVARLVGLLVVALHHDLGAAGQLAHLALRQHPALLVQHDDLAAQPRLAHGVELVGMEVGLERAGAAALGQAVDLDQPARPALQAVGLDVRRAAARWSRAWP